MVLYRKQTTRNLTQPNSRQTPYYVLQYRITHGNRGIFYDNQVLNFNVVDQILKKLKKRRLGVFDTKLIWTYIGAGLGSCSV